MCFIRQSLRLLVTTDLSFLIPIAVPTAAPAPATTAPGIPYRLYPYFAAFLPATSGPTMHMIGGTIDGNPFGLLLPGLREFAVDDPPALCLLHYHGRRTEQCS